MKKFILAILIAGCLSCCTDNDIDNRLERVESVSKENPEAALDSLINIPYGSLDEADRHLYDFLKIKLSDKAYIQHTSDSLILDVIDYESRNSNLDRYVEALYYGGRVYSDLGDYPTSMHYFQKAIETLPSNTHNYELSSKLESQYGRLLNSLRLYDEAIPHLIKSVKQDRILKDTINEVYDLQLLGAVEIHAHEYKSAEKIIREAIAASKNLAPYHMARSSMYMAAIKNKIGQNDSALLYIRYALQNVNKINRNMVLAHAINIYLNAGINDTAYIYAKELIENKDPNNKHIGYQTLLMPEIRPLVGNMDTIDLYIDEYRKLFERNFNNNENQLSLIGQSMFNYHIQQKEKEKEKKEKKILFCALIITMSICFVMLITIFIFRRRNKVNALHLQSALGKIADLEENLQKAYIPLPSSNEYNKSVIVENNTERHSDEIMNDELRKNLRNVLLEKFENMGGVPPEISTTITSSTAYGKLKENISQRMALDENDPLWEGLEKIVTDCSPEFKSNLKILVGGTFSSYDYKTALLVKCGISTGEMAKLFGRTKGAMVSRRHSLSLRIFEEQKSTKFIDGFIRML